MGETIARNKKAYHDYTILEKYEVIFLDNTTQNNTHFMQHLLTRLESANKTTEFIENIRQDKGNFLYNFTELPVEQIGEETYLGVNNTTIFQINVTIYMLCFKINDIGVVLLSPYFSKEDLIMYAKTVETRIQEIMETKEYTRLATNPRFNMKDLKELNGWIDPVINYIKDYVSLNAFV